MEADLQLAVVQAAVTMTNPELGPFLSRLPDELLIYIFTIVATTLSERRVYTQRRDKTPNTKQSLNTLPDGRRASCQ